MKKTCTSKENIKKCLSLFLFLVLSLFSCGTVNAASDSINVTQQVTGGSSGGSGVPTIIIPPVISDIIVYNITFNSAEVSWNTNEPASAELDHGKTISYEIETSKDHELSLLYFHKIIINNLEDNTEYYFRVRSRNSNGIESSESGSFVTLQDLREPANVINFTAQSFEGEIILNWNNPNSDNFSGVQINKKINSPALNSEEGEIIYRGNRETFDDLNIENGIKYYYTAFFFDALENFSSGAIASAIGIKIAVPPVEPPVTPDPPIAPDLPITPPEIFPADVENLETISNLGNKEIEIRWDIPEFEEFQEVEIYKSVDFPALVPGEGEIIYKGGENSFTDGNIEPDIIYYYTAFIKDRSGNYSAGKSTTGTLEKLPPPLTDKINIKDVNFIFSKEALLLPQRDDRKIYTFPGKEINIYYDSKNLPETLKTIMVTVGRSSYILNLDSDNEFYRTKFISPDVAGNYPITISVLDFKHGKIFQEKSELVVEDHGEVTGKLSDLDSAILKIKNYFGIFGTEKYLLENTKIILYEFDEEENWMIWNGEKYNQKNPQLTDESGNFGFMVSNGKYKIVAEKENYILKSEIIEVENNIINSKIEIKGKSDWLILIIIIVILFLVLIVRRKFKKIQ